MFRLSIGIWKGFQHSLGIGKMQIKTKIRYDLIFVRLSVVEKTRKNMCFWECGRKGNLCTVGGNLSWCKKIKWILGYFFIVLWWGKKKIQRGLNSPHVFQMRKLEPGRQLLARGHPVTLLLSHLGPQPRTTLELPRNPNPSSHSRPPESEALKMELNSLCLKPHRLSLKQQNFLLAGSHIFQSS